MEIEISNYKKLALSLSFLARFLHPSLLKWEAILFEKEEMSLVPLDSAVWEVEAKAPVPGR